MFYHGNKHLKNEEQLRGNPVFLTEVPKIAYGYCKSYDKISLWRPNKKLRLLNLTSKNIKLLLKSIPDTQKINIDVADFVFTKFSQTAKEKREYLEEHIPKSSKIQLSAREVIKYMPWKNLMQYSNKWKGYSTYGRAFGIYQPPPLFLGKNGNLYRSSVYQADALLFHHLTIFIRKQFKIDGIYSNVPKFDIKSGGFKGATVMNELIVQNTDIYRDKIAEKQFRNDNKKICKLLSPILKGKNVNKPKYTSIKLK